MIKLHAVSLVNKLVNDGETVIVETDEKLDLLREL